MKVALSDIRTDGGTQPRASINEPLVCEYEEAMRAGDQFPPITVFWDGVSWWLADGFHRLHAARRAGSAEIDVDRHEGTRRDAILHSVSANSAHGQRRTNSDKRKAVMTLLRDEEWGQWSDREIARRCAVHHQMVGKVRSELNPSLDDSSSEKRQTNADKNPDRPTGRTYTTKHGTTATMNTENIGKRAEVEPETEQPEPGPPKSRGQGLRYAHEAIAALRRIPKKDGLRGDALDLVQQWINDNR